MKSLEHYYIVIRRWIFRPLLKNQKIAHYLSKHCLRTYLAMFYENWTGKRLNLRHPQDFNQQLIKLSLEAYKDPIQHKLRVECADKALARDYVRSKGLEDILIPSYGVYDSFDEIDFDKLPNQFVIQYNFGCGLIWICKDKEKELSNIEKWRKQFNEWNKLEDEGYQTGEWHYEEMPHKLVITKYLDSLGEISVNDYKFHCMHGQIYGCFVAYDRIPSIKRSVQFDHYDLDWNCTDGIIPSWHPNRRLVPKPKCFDQMQEIARILSKDFPYCRVDLYEIEGKVLFGELTFTPQGCVLEFYTNEALVDMLKFYQETAK